jgi:ABC-type glutathione transport system ATPase component
VEPLLIVEKLEKRYGPVRRAQSEKEVAALQGVSFSVRPRSTLAVVGESGSGKSTLAFCVACLEKPTSGSIKLDGMELTTLDRKQLRSIHPQLQLVFQDPARSLNPRFTALEVISEPLIVQGRLSGPQRENRAQTLLTQVGISQQRASDRVAEFSGGQRQRLAIARALALEPKLLILDEALSALDCSVQAQIANLLLELQASLGLTYLFVTHDLTMAGHLADEIAVMEQGTIVELGPAERVLSSPAHIATRRLISATPELGAVSPAPQVV